MFIEFVYIPDDGSDSNEDLDREQECQQAEQGAIFFTSIYDVSLSF